VAKRAALRDQAGARRLHFAFEELRVALFAPELKPAQAVTVASVTVALAALR
jgi:ATP-dependent helicase HrpA